jgi:hypothetical protein
MPNEDPLRSLEITITTNTRDWSARRADAWLYGILVGWSIEDLPKVAARHHWPTHTVARLQRLRAAYLEIKKGRE